MGRARNGKQLRAGKDAVRPRNRNFEGRQGQGGRTFLASALTAAASAIAGVVTDPRTLPGIETLAAVGGLGGLPVYSIPFAMASRLNLVGASISTVLFPRLGGDGSEGSTRRDDVLARWSAAATIAVSGALSTAIVIVGPHFLRLWLGGTLGDQAGAPSGHWLSASFSSRSGRSATP